MNEYLKSLDRIRKAVESTGLDVKALYYFKDNPRYNNNKDESLGEYIVVTRSLHKEAAALYNLALYVMSVHDSQTPDFEGEHMIDIHISDNPDYADKCINKPSIGRPCGACRHPLRVVFDSNDGGFRCLNAEDKSLHHCPKPWSLSKYI